MKNIYVSPELDIIKIKASQVLTGKSGDFDLEGDEDNFLNP